MTFANHLETLEAKVEAINRRPRLWLCIFALLFAIQISPWWYPKPDGCFYLSIARTMVAGSPTANDGDVFRPANPGYPLLISPAFLLGDRPFLAISALHWLMAVVCILGVYRWARRQFPAYAVLLTGLAVLNNAVWIHYRRTIKEIAFMAFIVWSVNVVQALTHKRSNASTALLCGVAALLITACALVRYPGMVLLAGFALAMCHSAHRGRLSWSRAAIVTLAVSLLPTMTVLYRINYEENLAQRQGGTTYGRQFNKAVSIAVSDAKQVFVSAEPESNVFDKDASGDRDHGLAEVQDRTPITVDRPDKSSSSSNGGAVVANTSENKTLSSETASANVHDGLLTRIAANRFFEGLRLRISSVGQITLPGMLKAYNQTGSWMHVNMFVYGTWFFVVLAGWWYLVRRRNDVFALLLPFYFAIYIIWPFDQGARFLVPMAPVLMASAWYGMRRLPIRYTSALGMCVFMHCSVAIVYWAGMDAPRAYALHQNWPHVDRLIGHMEFAGASQPSAVVGVSPKQRTRVRLMFELCIDRPVDEYSTLQSVPESVQWVVLPEDVSWGDSYELIERAGDFQLIRRLPADERRLMKIADSTAKAQSARSATRQ